MMSQPGFTGFPKESTQFYIGLKENNHKAWFEEHRSDFDDYVLAPAREFVTAMGARLRRIAPMVQADPRVNRSLFRIHRDTRFSRDKSPYKTHLGIWFWEGQGPRMESSGFYVHFEPPNLMLGVGIYIFPKHLLGEYRDSVVHPRHGKELARAITRVSQAPGCTLGGKHYKRVPRGFDPEHRNAELLLFNGLYAGVQTKSPREFHSSRILDFCYDRFKRMVPLHRWLLAMTQRPLA